MTKTLKIAIAQMNPTVGDYTGNTAKILRWIDEADKKGADLVVFPECALCGYPVWDLANKKAFVDEGLKFLNRIVVATRGKKLAAILGFIDKNNPSSYNAAAWLEDGKIRAVYHKRLLPTYDVFLEEIFFKAGEKSCVVSFRGRKFGLTICEDIWDASYDTKPLQDLKRKGADFVINISASPFYGGVAKRREALVCAQIKKYRFPLLYVNLVGGQDDLLFDGRSFLMDSASHVQFQASAFTEGLFFVNLPPLGDRVSEVSAHFGDRVSEGCKEMYQALVMGVRDYFRKNGFKKAVIGLSGGIDSALVAVIAVDARGKDAVKGVTMPGPFSSEGSWKDSERLAKNLGIEFETRPIKDMYKSFLDKEDERQKSNIFKTPSPLSAPSLKMERGLGEGDDLKSNEPTLAMENLQARLRGMELMFLSNHEGRLVLTTGNKSELAMGYCTLYGDMAGGIAVIGDVYKTDVYRLARYRNTVQIPINFLGEEIGAVQTTIMEKKRKVWTVKKVIPEPIFTKAPSAELRPNQKDQDSLPSYDVLDEILHLYIEKNLSRDEIVRKLKGTGNQLMPVPMRKALVAEIIRKVDHNEYKRRQTPPILRVTEKAWFGRRMPITNRFQR